jgi:hypothetical protein
MPAQLTNTLSQYVIRIRRYLRETIASISHWDDDFLKQVFNTSYRKRCGDLIMAHEGFFTIIGTRDLVANQGRYAWPTGFSRLLKLEIVRSDGRRVPVQRDERHFAVADIANVGGDQYVPTYRPVGSGFVLEPPPSEGVTNGLQLEWNGVPEELTADGDALHSDFPVLYDELLVLDTAISLFDSEGMQESGQMRTLLRLRQEWEQQWEQFIQNRMISIQKVVPFITHFNDA